MLIRFKCNNSDCSNEITKFFKNFKDITSFLDCGECSIGKLERQLGAAHTKSVQFIDNGTSPKAVEVTSEVVLKEFNKVQNEP